MSDSEKRTEFSRKSTHIARRAWNIVRLALLWARRGGLFRNKHRLAVALEKLTRKLTHLRHEARGALAYGDREFSIDETPVFHFRMRRRSRPRFGLPHIPCVSPEVVDFDWDEDLIPGGGGEVWGCRYEEENGAESEKGGEELQELEERNGDYEEGIDSRAEIFIAEFYEQMKLQRQISYLRHKNSIKNCD